MPVSHHSLVILDVPDWIGSNDALHEARIRN